MKKPLFIIFALALPVITMAQWNPVRFDQHNFFAHEVALAAQSAVCTGTDPLTNGSFLMRTNNAGLTWDSIPINGSSGACQVMCLRFIDLNNGFAGGLSGTNQSLLVTGDNGTTWTDITPDTSSTEAINTISFIDGFNGYAASDNNIYKTTDAGNSWTAVNSPSLDIEDISFPDMVTGYAGGIAGLQAEIKKTTDGGITWNTVFSAAVPGLFSTGSKKLDLISNNVLYSSLLYTNMLVRTTNGGVSWDTIFIPQIFEVQDFDFISFTEGHVLSSMGEIYVTTDGGSTWSLEYAVASGAYGPSVFLNSISFVENIGYVCGSNGLIKRHDPTVATVNEPDMNILALYPNPAAVGDVIMFNIKPDHIYIYNGLGSVVYENATLLSSGINITDLHLSAGIYTVVVRSNGRTSAEKLIIAEQ